uniref:Zinc finger CCCH domain-containing protein 6 n=1 Tax=Panagrellus redivivus TaxID=6233 RepID=A0A7E5A227_PANRE
MSLTNGHVVVRIATSLVVTTFIFHSSNVLERNASNSDQREHEESQKLIVSKNWSDAMSGDGEAPEPIPVDVQDTPDSPSPTQNAMVVGDVEEGELPEDGEIQDDEESEAPRKASKTNGNVPIDDVASQVLITPADPKPPSPREPVEHHTPARPPYREISPDRRHAPRRSRSPVRYGPPSIPNRRRPWTENVMCKFFREGYCRDDMDCSYSHNAALSNRKPELCKFYSQGFCKKGLACTLLHGEYPCKDFHRGHCTRKPCKYSHLPLNEYTQAIFDQVVQDETIAAQIKIPHAPTRRRTLLAKPPPSGPPGRPISPPERQASSPLKRPYPDEPMEVTSYSAHNLPVPPSRVSDNFTAATAAEDPDELLVAGDDYRNQSDVAYQNQIEDNRPPIAAPMAQAPPPVPVPAQVPPPAFGVMSLDDMLNQLASGPSEGNVQKVVSNFTQHDADIADTPASPDHKPEPLYLLIPIDPTPTGYDANILKKLNSERFKNDPRAAVIVQKQFDHDSSVMTLSLPTVPQPSPAPAPVAAVSSPSGISRDPRLRNAIPNDPRIQRTTLRPSGGLLPTPAPLNPPPVGTPVVPATPDYMADQHFQSLVEKQLQMVNQVNQNPDREPEAPSASQYTTAPRRHYDDESHHRGYSSPRGGYSNSHRGDYDGGYAPRSRYHDDGGYRGRPPRYSGPRGGYRGGYHDDDRYRSGPPRSSYSSERHEPGSFTRSDGYRRDYRDRREPYPPRHRDSRYRSRSRSPLRPSRSDKDYDGYQSPETRA